MHENPIKKGLKVQLELEVGILPNSRTRIDCYILEPEHDRLTISFPEDKSEFLPYLTEGTEIKAFIYSLSGIFIVDSIIYDAPVDGKMMIEFNEEHQTLQRRKYERVPYITDLYTQGVDGNIKMQTVDISGGGIRFISSIMFKEYQKIPVMLRLVAFEPLIKAEGVILKKHFFGKDEYVIEFIDIDEFDREKIIQKCDELKKKTKDS